MSSVKSEPVDAAGGIISQPDFVPVVINEAESQTDGEEDEMEEDEKDLINDTILCPNEVRTSNKTTYQAIRDTWEKHPHNPTAAELALVLSTAHAALSAWDKRLNPPKKYISYMISNDDFLLIISTIKKIACIVKIRERKNRIKPTMLKKLEQETTDLFNLYRKYSI